MYYRRPQSISIDIFTLITPSEVSVFFPVLHAYVWLFFGSFDFRKQQIKFNITNYDRFYAQIPFIHYVINTCGSLENTKQKRFYCKLSCPFGIIRQFKCTDTSSKRRDILHGIIIFFYSVVIAHGGISRFCKYYCNIRDLSFFLLCKLRTYYHERRVE